MGCQTWSSYYGLPLTTKPGLPAPLYCWARCIEASYFFLRKRMIRGKRFVRSKSNIVIGHCRTFGAGYLEIELATRQELRQFPLRLRLLLPFPPPLRPVIFPSDGQDDCPHHSEAFVSQCESATQSAEMAASCRSHTRQPSPPIRRSPFHLINFVRQAHPQLLRKLSTAQLPGPTGGCENRLVG